MRDDQRPDNPSDPGDRRDAFDDALDDLFGPDTTPDPELPATEPPQPTVSPSSQPLAFDQESYRPREPGPPASSPPLAPPPQRSTGPGIRGWTWRKAGCYTCLGFFGIIFACLVILFIIGFVTDDPADPGPAGHFLRGVAWV